MAVAREMEEEPGGGGGGNFGDGDGECGGEWASWRGGWVEKRSTRTTIGMKMTTLPMMLLVAEMVEVVEMMVTKRVLVAVSRRMQNVTRMKLETVVEEACKNSLRQKLSSSEALGV